MEQIVFTTNCSDGCGKSGTSRYGCYSSGGGDKTGSVGRRQR